MKKTFYNNLMGCLTKRGKRQKAKQILDQSLLQTSKVTRNCASKILYRLASKLGNLIELRKLKIRKNVILVPFLSKKNRRQFLVSKQLVSELKTNRKKFDGATKLSEHMRSFLLKGGDNFNKRKLYQKQILANRSNLHFRY